MSGESKFEPTGRYRRFWWDFEVEVVDEMALRTFDLHALSDEEGELIGMAEMSDNDRISWALVRLFRQAVESVESELGVKLTSSGGFPMAWSVDANADDGYYQEWVMGRRPVRGDDGEWVRPFPPVE